jgi:hypothetical protein
MDPLIAFQLAQGRMAELLQQAAQERLARLAPKTATRARPTSRLRPLHVTVPLRSA